MGINTKGVVVTGCKEVMFVCERVEAALSKLIRPYWRLYRYDHLVSDTQPAYAMPEMRILPSSGTVQFFFRYAGQQRTLWLHFECDSDNLALGPQSLVMSMGCWGDSELLVRTALDALSPVGPGFMDVSDCDNEGYVPLQGEPYTFLGACAAKLARPFCTSLSAWYSAYQRGALREGAIEDVLGLSEKDVVDILSLSFDDARMRLEALVMPLLPEHQAVAA